MTDVITKFNELHDAEGKRAPLIKNQEMAAQACFILIAAYCNDPEDVDWSDIQAALNCALVAYGLQSDFPERVCEAENASDDAE